MNQKSFSMYARALFLAAVTILLLAITSVVVTFFIIISFGRAQNFLIENVGPILGKSVLRLAGIRFIIDDLRGDFKGPAVYISNHSSTLDLFILVGLGLDCVRFVAKTELQYNPFFWIMGNLTGNIFIKRQNTEKAVRKLQQTYARIRDRGLSLFVAPEGTRKHPGRIGPFKKGAFRMAIDLRYPLVPIYIQGARELCPGGSLRVHPGEVRVTIHPPIETDAWSVESLEQHMAEVRDMYLQWDRAATDQTTQSPHEN